MIFLTNDDITYGREKPIGDGTMHKYIPRTKKFKEPSEPELEPKQCEVPKCIQSANHLVKGHRSCNRHYMRFFAPHHYERGKQYKIKYKRDLNTGKNIPV